MTGMLGGPKCWWGGMYAWRGVVMAAWCGDLDGCLAQSLARGLGRESSQIRKLQNNNYRPSCGRPAGLISGRLADTRLANNRMR